MKFEIIDPPRTFNVGPEGHITLKDCAHIALEPDEQVTFVTDSGAEYDVARKSWGFYATPSLNGRLQSFGLRAVLVKGPVPRYYVFLVESGKEADFQDYLDSEGHTIVCWLDSDEILATLEQKLKGAKHAN